MTARTINVTTQVSVTVRGVKKRCRKSELHTFDVVELELPMADVTGDVLETVKLTAKAKVMELMKSIDAKPVMHLFPIEYVDYGDTLISRLITISAINRNNHQLEM